MLRDGFSLNMSTIQDVVVKLDASTLTITSLNLGSARPKLTTFGGVKIQSLVQYNGLLISSKPKKPLVACRASTSEAKCGFVFLVLSIFFIHLIACVFFLKFWFIKVLIMYIFLSFFLV